nr:ROK family transcriptional regulator [Demequina sp. TTPB684]
MREANSARLLAAVRRFGGITQVELAEATGLSPATVSTIVKQLLAAGIVETRTTTRSGRRAQFVTLAHKSGLLIGAHIGSRALRLAVADSRFEILANRTLPLPSDHRLDTTLDRTALLAMELVDGLGSTTSEILGVGIGLPAPVDPERGMILDEGLMKGWADVPIADVVSARIAAPVAVDNDANLSALGETRFGAAKGFRDVLYVWASYGTGAGLIIGGEVHRGARGNAGEIGHTLVDPQGPICKCGSRGCLDTLVGAQALIDSLRISRGPMSLHDLVELASSGDPGCRQVVADAGAAIGVAAANLAVAFDPEVVVVGGDLAQADAILLDPIRAAMNRRVLISRTEPLEVRQGELGTLAPVHGALARAADLSHVPGGR